MKKSPNLNLVFSLLAVPLILSFAACKKSATGGSIGLTGTWTNKTLGAPDIVQLYNFKSNDSVEFYDYKIDTNTGKILGYGYKTIGKYKLENATLTMYNLASFLNPAGGFGPLSQLAPGNGSVTETYTIAIDSQKKQLSLYFTCPPSADCIPSPIIYFRQ